MTFAGHPGGGVTRAQGPGKETDMLRRFYTVMIVPHEGGALRRLSVSMNFLVSMAGIFLFCFVSSAFLVQFFLGGSAPTGDLDERLRAENERMGMELARTRGLLQETSGRLEQLSDKVEELGRAHGSWPDDAMGGGITMNEDEESQLFVADGGDWRAGTRAILEKAEYRMQQIDEKICELSAVPVKSLQPLTDTIWPTNGRLTSGYGWRRDPFDGSKRFHEGVDIAAPFDSNVWTIADGVVIEARRHGGYGNMVLVDHGGGRKTLYGHLRRVKVSVGDRVKKGDVVGTVGSTGRATGPHVHFEVLENDRTVDPKKTLGKTLG